MRRIVLLGALVFVLVDVRAGGQTECAPGSSCTVQLVETPDNPQCVTGPTLIFVHAASAPVDITWKLPPRYTFKLDPAPHRGIEIPPPASGWRLRDQGASGNRTSYTWTALPTAAGASAPYTMNVKKGNNDCTPLDPVIVNMN